MLIKPASRRRPSTRRGSSWAPDWVGGVGNAIPNHDRGPCGAAQLAIWSPRITVDVSSENTPVRRSAPPPSPRYKGRGAWRPTQTRLPSGRVPAHPIFITSCGPRKAILIRNSQIVIPSEAEESKPVIGSRGAIQATTRCVKPRYYENRHSHSPVVAGFIPLL